MAKTASGLPVDFDLDKIIGQLELIVDSVDMHYKHPLIAPNGKAEGLCLSVRGLRGIIKQLREAI